jgi:uncharacterized protein (DUF2236 family)
MFEEWQLDKENFESYLDHTLVDLPLSDKVWKQIVDDVEGQVANYLNELMRDIAQDVHEGFYDD